MFMSTKVYPEGTAEGYDINAKFCIFMRVGPSGSVTGEMLTMALVRYALRFQHRIVFHDTFTP
jgi:hypothetical protein